MSQTNITPINPDDFSTETYLASDENLITSNIEENQFDPNTDYIEFSIYDLNNNIIYPGGEDFSFSNYSLIDNEIYVDPEIDVARSGITTGEVNVNYSFFRKRLNSSPQSTYYIKEISSDRTEIRLDSNIISKEDIISSTNEFVAYREADETFPDFYLNLGSNILFIANNIRLEEDGTVLIKLYEPLPANIETKTSLWVVEKISEGLAYNLKFNNTVILPTNTLSIKGPNLNLSIKDEVNNPSEDTNLDLYTSPNSQSEYQISSYFADPSIKINVDYSDFSNFVNFSSAKARIENFWSKVSLIESASEQLAIQSSLNQTSAVSSSVSGFNGIINDTITNFDNYEYYLYFESSSNTYPKTNTSPPFENESTGSIVAQSWYNDKILEAENYDEFNYNWLKYSSPEYIQNDPDNDQYMTFLNMVGHFVDNDIWVYLKDTTNKWDADNRIDAGVSKDLIAQVLRDLGIKIYQNNYSSADLYSSFLGFTDSGSLFPFPYMTGSVLNGGLLETPQGYEYISNFISSSDEAIPLDDINKRIYKRIYHNLPYLLKSKGTVAGLRTLINSYGIPDTILRISEFGGKDKNNVNDWDLWNHQYNFKSNIGTGGSITTDWELDSDWGSTNDRPDSLQFRFNAGLAVSASATQSLWDLDSGTNVSAVLEYDTSLLNSGSYSGSVKSEEYQYATLKFTLDNFSTSTSVRLPFYNNDWWSVQINREGNDFELLAGNKIYSGSDGSQIGFIASSSITTAASSNWGSATTSKFDFEGSYQEIRYFNQAISQSVFKDYVMNPQSIEGNGVNGSPSQLAFRASLGGELYTGSVSIHPKVATTSSFTGGNSFTTSSVTFEENKEWIFYDSPAVGIKNRNTDKIKQQELILPSGNTLSNLGSIQQKSYTTQDYTNNLNLLEVAFSPQNQINDDIISQIGHFNIGDYIGDPRLVSSSANTYPSLVELSKQYFEKYTSSYDVYDYIRLIKFFDNSLFKMVKDFVPARTGLASGIVVKQHILERQKYPTPQVEWTRPEYTGSIGQTASSSSDYQKEYIASTDFESNPIVVPSGSDGGSILKTNVTQSWDGINITPVGDLSFTQNDEREFINGEFSGSSIVTTDGELNTECDTFKKADTTEIQYYLSSSVPENTYDFIFTPVVGSFITMKDTSTNDGLKVYLQWSFDRSERPALAPFRNYFWNVVGFSIKIPESANAVDVEDYITSLKELKLLNVNFVGSDVTNLTGWSGINSKTFTNAVDPILIPKSFKIYDAHLNSGRFIYVETEPSEMEFKIQLNVLGGGIAGNLYGFDIAAKGLINTIFEPFVPQTFENSDCNPLYGNAVEDTPSTVYYDIDYSQNSITPINFDTIIAGTANKAELQDYNYFARRSIIPRYSGSKNTSNLPYNTTSYVVNQFSGSNQPIERRDSIITEFDWGGGTYPEIYDGGGVQLRQHLLAGSDRDAVELQTIAQEGFTNTLKQSFPLNSTPVINQYTTVSGNTIGARVAAYGFSVPSKSTFALPADSTPSSILATADNKIYMTSTADEAYLVTTTSAGFETTGSVITGDLIYTTMNESLEAGEQWYITFYENMPGTLQGDLTPYTGDTSFYSQRNSRGEYLDPLKSRGVWRIKDVESQSTTRRIELADSVSNFISSNLTLGGSGGTVGFLIWKAKTNDNLMLFVDATMSGVGKSGMTTQTPTSVIEQNFDYITLNFGSNTTTS